MTAYRLFAGKRERAGGLRLNHTAVPCPSAESRGGTKLFRSLGLGGSVLLSNCLVQPILAVREAGDDEGHHIVAGGVDHGGGRIDQVADGDQDGERQLDLVGEEDGADDVLADVAAAGDAGHTDGGQHRHEDDGIREPQLIS